MNSTFVTVASVKWTGLLSSNSAAKAWCALSGDADKSNVMPATAPMVSLARMILISRFSISQFSHSFRCGWVARNVALVNLLARRNLARDVNIHGFALPVLDELLFAQMAIQGLFHHLDTLEIHELGIRLQPPIEGHTDLPRSRKYLRVLNGGFVVDYIFAGQS